MNRDHMPSACGPMADVDRSRDGRSRGSKPFVSYMTQYTRATSRHSRTHTRRQGRKEFRYIPIGIALYSAAAGSHSLVELVLNRKHTTHIDTVTDATGPGVPLPDARAVRRQEHTVTTDATAGRPHWQ